MKTFEYEIEVDTYARNPRDEFDNLSRFLCPSSSRYITGGKTDLEFHPNDDGGENLRWLKKQKALIVEFYNPNVGTCYAFVTREQLKKEYLDHGYSMRKAMYHARKCAQGEIDIYLAWANGEVYGYTIKDDDGNIVDSCWGFYGYKDCEEEVKAQIKYLEEQEREEDKQLLNRLQFA